MIFLKTNMKRFDFDYVIYPRCKYTLTKFLDRLVLGLSVDDAFCIYK